MCGSTCTDTNSDPRNCSTCGRACSTTVAHAVPACSGGLCSQTSAPSYTSCNGACVDLASDPNNCGGCGSTFACASPMSAAPRPASALRPAAGPVSTPTPTGRLRACGHELPQAAEYSGRRPANRVVVLASGQAMPGPWLDATSVYWNRSQGDRRDHEGLAGRCDSHAARHQSGGHSASRWTAPASAGSTAGYSARHEGRLAVGPQSRRPGTAGASCTERWPGPPATSTGSDDLGGGRVGTRFLLERRHADQDHGCVRRTCHIAHSVVAAVWLGYPGQDTVESGPSAGGARPRFSRCHATSGHLSDRHERHARLLDPEEAAGTLQSVPARGGYTNDTVHRLPSVRGPRSTAGAVYWSDGRT